MIRASRRWAGIVSWLLCCGCSDVTLVVGKFGVPAAGEAMAPSAGQGGARSDPSAGVGMPATGGAGAPAMTQPVDRVGIEVGTHDQFCQGRGVALQSLHAGTATDCHAQIERRLFSYALCACNELRLQTDSFLLDSFDSSQGAYMKSQTGAAVGVNGSLAPLAGDTQLLGSVRVADGGSIALTGTNFFVSDDFRTNAALEAGTATARFARDLWVAGDIHAQQNALAVERDAYQTPGHTGISSLQIGGSAHPSTDFSVPPPCACDDAAPLDVAALVDQARIMNDNAASGWSPDSLSVGFFGLIADLPCGRLYAKSLVVPSGNGANLSVRGRTALFIDGDVTLGSTSTVNVATADSGGELDLFIRGSIVIDATSTLTLGAAARPAALRVYVGGDIMVKPPISTIPFHAQLYAPHASVELPAPNTLGILTEVHGSIFARNISVSSKQRMHYDRAILHASAECSAPAPQRCDACQECPGDLACVAGSCSACTRDADCCAPTTCANGKCQTLVSNAP
jgi:hypothetical protein